MGLRPTPRPRREAAGQPYGTAQRPLGCLVRQVSRPSPPGGLRPALTRSGAAVAQNASRAKSAASLDACRAKHAVQLPPATGRGDAQRRAPIKQPSETPFRPRRGPLGKNTESSGGFCPPTTWKALPRLALRFAAPPSNCAECSSCGTVGTLRICLLLLG